MPTAGICWRSRRARSRAARRPDPVTITAHFLSPGKPGDATIRCRRIRQGKRFSTATVHRVDLRLHPDDAGFRIGAPSGIARMRGWFRLAGGERADTITVLMGTDAFPPTIFNARLPVGWTPTVELTAHVRARPAPGWLRARFTTRFVTGGFLEEDGELWDSSERLVAQSRQLALVPRDAQAVGAMDEPGSSSEGPVSPG